MSTIEITKSNFEEIYDYWKDFLWPGRKSKIEACSSMTYFGGYDLAIKDFGEPVFWKITSGNRIIGVNSGHSTATTAFRSRGLWVHPDYRKRGFGQKLLEPPKREAIKRNCKFIWSAPRKEAINTYLSFGFLKTSEWFNSGMEFGPNCYVKLDLLVNS